jgi:flagellar biogenesis protein FliO
MSWPAKPLNQTLRLKAGTACRSAAARWSLALALLLVANQGGAQENPLRDGAFDPNSGTPIETRGESGYLEQLLPSLQKLQAESPAPLPLPNQDHSAGGSHSNSGSQGISQTQAGGTQAGVWSAEPPSGSSARDFSGDGNLSRGGDLSPAANQTETRLADNRPAAAWPDFGTPAPVAAAAATSAKSTSPPGLGTAGSTRGGLGVAGSRLAAFQGVESLQLNSTLVKVGLNTLLVLAATVGLIMVARKTLPRQQPNQQRPAGRLRIEQTLSLGGKAELKVVRCGLNQVLVAIDGGGIRSVVALEPALETEREHLEPAAPSQPANPVKEPVNIEQFVKMIKDMEGDFMAARTGR